LAGTVPRELGAATNLKELFLHGNPLTGSIPSELASLTKLTWLKLNANALTGSVPTELCNLLVSSRPSLNLTIDCDRVSCGCGGCACAYSNISRTASSPKR
jgi:Leucine-rich repeat (LRR) protein